MCLPHTFLPLPPQSDRHGWTQAANKTRIKRVSTHQAAAGKVREHAQSCLALFYKLLFIILLIPPILHFISLCSHVCMLLLPLPFRALTL